MHFLPVGKAAQEGRKVGHDFHFLATACLPAKPKGGQQGAQIRLVKATTLQHSPDKLMQMSGIQPVPGGKFVEAALPGTLAERQISLADSLFVQSFAGSKRINIRGDGIALIHELGV